MYQILRMGYNTLHDTQFSVNRPNGYPWYLLLFTKSPASFTIQGVTYETPPDTLIIYNRNEPHYYEAKEVAYQNDWIHFECDGTDFDSLSIPLNQPLFIPNALYISELTAKLSSEFYSTNLYREASLNHLMHLLFIKIAEGLSKAALQSDQVHSKLYDDLIMLRSNIISNPQLDWNIPDMAKSLNISAGYFQSIYKDTFAIPCMTEIIINRVSRAKELLAATNLLVSEIAVLCGYKTEVHFMRQFKKQTTLTPSAYRKLNR